MVNLRLAGFIHGPRRKRELPSPEFELVNDPIVRDLFYIRFPTPSSQPLVYSGHAIVTTVVSVRTSMLNKCSH